MKVRDSGLLQFATPEEAFHMEAYWMARGSIQSAARALGVDYQTVQASFKSVMTKASEARYSQTGYMAAAIADGAVPSAQGHERPKQDRTLALIECRTPCKAALTDCSGCENLRLAG